ncbi:MAG: ABC transporter permease subunit [Deltaproteobacteria bacterium]|nr:ABC transporter permease subunit [Deltaproteobacteria bacterium]
MENTLKKPPIIRPPHYNLWVTVFVVFILLIIGSFYYSTQRIEYIWRWNRMPIYFAYLDIVKITSEIDGEVDDITLDGKDAHITVKGMGESETYTVPAEGVYVEDGELISPGDILATGVIIGVVGGLARISSNPAFRWTVMIYVELIRGSPLMVQIIIWYFVLGTVINDILSTYGLGRLSAFWYGVASLSCFAGAYVTEIVRAGIQSIHRGQTEAARSLGMTYAQSMRYIILPQALRSILPPLAGQFISLIKDSSLLGIIAIREVTKAAREAVTASLQPFELYIMLLLLYLVLTFSLSMFVQYLERRTAIK